MRLLGGSFVEVHFLDMMWDIIKIVIIPIVGGLVFHYLVHGKFSWLDKAMPWRHARGEWLDNVILVSPSPEYVQKLPHGKLPDRRDFVRFEGDDARRMKYWRAAIAQSARLGDEFLEFARRPDPARVLPL